MATAMSATSKRKGRTSAGGRWRPNQSDQWNMPPRNPSSNQSRNPVDSFKSGKMRIPNDGEGVYGNSRFLYVAMCLIGTPVSIQVKNGNVYEGILVTFSQKMEIVLSMAHKVDDRLNPNNNSVIPNKENVIDNLIIKCAEIVKLEAKNVDLDYAVKDAYSESSSSRLNGQLPDKDLTPWEGDIEDGKMTSLESDASNGWDPSDMFKTNYEQFNVKSTYDENLSQYTTPLEKRDTKEYKEREEAAAKLADEIERSDSYKHRISLENGEGEDEEKFAAVIKPEVSNNNAGTGRNPGRKIPNRSGGASLRGGSHSPSNLNNSNQVLNNNNGNSSNSSNSREILCNTTQSKPCISIPASAPSTGSQQQQPQVTPPPPLPPPPPSITTATPTSTQQPQSTSAALQQISSSQSQIVQPSHSNYSQQAQSREQQPPQPQSLPLQPQVSKAHESPVVSPTLESIKVNGTSEKEKECSTDRSPAVPAESKDTVHASSVPDDCRRNSNTKGERAMEIQALKQFSSNIKLSGDKDKERVEKQERQDKSEERKETEKNKEFEKSDKLSAKVKNSTLNPNAKEFNPKTYPQKHCVQTPPPPRPQTQSPVAISQQLFAPYIVPMSMQATPQQATNQSNRFTTTKRIVSVPRHDFNAQAAAATGQPLLAQTALQAAPYISYFSVPPPTPTHYPQLWMVKPDHMMTMTPGSRLTSSVPLVPTSHPGSMEQTGNHQHSAQPVFVASAGPVPTHMQHHPNHGPMSHPTPTHMGHHPGGGHTQGNQMNTQGSGHPAQSPVQTQGPSSQQSQHPQHPPSSGTPQPQPPPQMNYQQMSIQGHPPLQGSPHNPTSPPSVHPVSLPYPLPPHSHMQATGAQMSVQTGAQGHPQTSVTHSQMHTHSPHVNQQIVMMPQPPTAHPHTPQHMQPQPVQPGHHFQGHPMPGSHVHAPSHHLMATQPATAIPVSSQSNVHQGQMHFLPVQSQGAPVQTYQQSQ